MIQHASRRARGLNRPAPAGYDLSHPDARGLRVLVPYSGRDGAARDLIARANLLSPFGLLTWGYSRVGPARRCPTQATNGYDEIPTPPPSGSGAWTIAAGVQLDVMSGGTADIQPVFYLQGHPAQPFIRFGDSAGAGRLQLSFNGTKYDSTVTRSPGVHYWIELVYDGGTSARMYVNGALDVAATVTSATWAGATTYLARDDSDGRTPLGYFTGFRFYERARTAGEVRATARDPFALFGRPKRRRAVGSGASPPPPSPSRGRRSFAPRSFR